MDKIIRRLVLRLFPELTAGLHLPRLGRVVDLPELPQQGGETQSDPFYPRYAADIQLLDENGNDCKTGVLQAVALPVPGIGAEAGRLEPPAIGAIVEIAFAYGRPDQPFIRTVLPLGWKLPAIKQGESRNQQRPGVYHLVDDAGNFQRVTDKDDYIECLNQRIKTLENKVQEIGGNLTETIKGIKDVTAEKIHLTGGAAVVTCNHICHYSGKPHGDGSSTVTAGK